MSDIYSTNKALFKNQHLIQVYTKSEYLNNLMLKVIFACLLIAISLSINYPLYKQCDPKWGSQRLGTSANTICSAGCLMSSAAMALFAIGNTQFNPSSLNHWLTNNKGYEDGDLFVWEAIERWGVSFIGKVKTQKLKEYIDKGYIVLPNVDNGKHWVLVTGYEGDYVLVHDAFYDKSKYLFSEIVEGNTGVYSINKFAFEFNNQALMKKTQRLQQQKQNMKKSLTKGQDLNQNIYQK